MCSAEMVEDVAAVPGGMALPLINDFTVQDWKVPAKEPADEAANSTQQDRSAAAGQRLGFLTGAHSRADATADCCTERGISSLAMFETHFADTLTVEGELGRTERDAMVRGEFTNQLVVCRAHKEAYGAKVDLHRDAGAGLQVLYRSPASRLCLRTRCKDQARKHAMNDSLASHGSMLATGSRRQGRICDTFGSVTWRGRAGCG